MTILGIYLLNQIRTGGNRKYLEIVEGLASRGVTVFVIMNSFLDYTPVNFIKIELPIKYGQHKFPPASFLFKKNVKENIRQIEEFISGYINTSVDFILSFGDTHLKSALFLRKIFKAPLFYGFRANDIDRAHILRAYGGMSLLEYLFSILYEPINRYREKQVARNAELISFLNNSDKNRFIERTGCSESKITVIPNHIGLPRCTPEFKNKNHSEEVKNIVYVGSLSADKGLWDLLKAIAILKKDGYTKPHYYMLGRPENINPTLNLIKELDIEELISIEGYKDPFPYFAKYDLFIYPSLYDSFGNVVTESLHTGCPVIASSVGGITDILSYPELLFKSGDFQEIADKIELCIKDKDHYHKIRQLCSERAEKYYFDWAERYENAMKAYKLKVD
ncbi:glycosyltransferase family 4 protein [Treponema primitia]|uniref:glycosyltransferase family 4 protein n=1 Tax=Treponema primitia TaxID=88058 RepID=UPI0039802ADF